MAVQWSLHLAAWIIQDGNYGDIARGDRLEAAVEFGCGTESLTLAVANEPSARHLGDCSYEVVGRVVVVEPDVWVIDIGIGVFNEHKPPPGLHAGDTISGRLELGVDPFFYFERLGKRPTMPPLIYTWHVAGIVRQTAPFVDVGPRMRARDPSKLGWESVEQTDAWVHDGGHGEYVLRCELQADAPKRARGAS